MKKTFRASFRIVTVSFLLVLYYPIFGQNELYIVRNTVSPCLNVRSDHDANSAIVGCLVPGTQVQVINSVPFWRQVTFGNNKTGWVAKKFIEPSAENTAVNGDSIIIPDSAFLTVNFVDVGQGDAIWIQTFDDGIDGNGIFEGYSIIIDGGPNSSDNMNPLLSFVESHGFHGAEIKALFVTHPHSDHYSGAETIARHFDIDNYYDPGYPSTLKSYQSFLKKIKGVNGNPPEAKHLHIGKENFGQLDWGKEIKAEILYAWPGNEDGSLGSGNTEVNNASIVLRLQYGKDVFLFMGDAEGKDRAASAQTPAYVEKRLLETVPDKLKASVLKIAHHGSETSSTLPFIQAVNPDVVIVESGRKSFRGTFLPDISTLRRYCAFNPDVKIYRTDQGDKEEGLKESAAADGDNIIIKSNGKGRLMINAFDHGNPVNPSFCNHPN